MDLNVRSQMRQFVMQRLRMRGDLSPVDDAEPLFTSGRLDSLDAVEVIMCVESDYGINFADFNFDLTLLDSVAAITSLIERHSVNA